MEELLETGRFEWIAEWLLNEAEIVCGIEVFRIIEIEFYWWCSTIHPDPYVHRDVDQLSVGQWYFHKTGQSYRGGTFKGLDITFAKGDYGGILIRSMMSSTGEIVEGPCKCVDRLLRAAQCATVADLARQSMYVFGGDLLRVQSRPLERFEVYRGARVGLRADKSPEYATKAYRFVTHPWLIKKARPSLIDGLKINHGMDDDQIRVLMGQVRRH